MLIVKKIKERAFNQKYMSKPLTGYSFTFTSAPWAVKKHCFRIDMKSSFEPLIWKKLWSGRYRSHLLAVLVVVLADVAEMSREGLDRQWTRNLAAFPLNDQACRKTRTHARTRTHIHIHTRTQTHTYRDCTERENLTLKETPGAKSFIPIRENLHRLHKLTPVMFFLTELRLGISLFHSLVNLNLKPD